MQQIILEFIYRHSKNKQVTRIEIRMDLQRRSHAWPTSSTHPSTRQMVQLMREVGDVAYFENTKTFDIVFHRILLNKIMV